MLHYEIRQVTFIHQVSVELEFAAYTNGGLEVKPKELQVTIDSTTHKITEFAETLSVSGSGLHQVTVTGVDEEDNTSSAIRLSFFN